MASQPPRLLDVSKEHDLRLLPQLAQMHHDLIVADHMLASFLHPLDMKAISAYWNAYVEEVKMGRRLIVIQSVQYEDHEEVTGLVTLFMPISETGPFRSEVHKLLVSPKHRYKGIARSLMTKVEEAALERGRWLVAGTPRLHESLADLPDARYHDWKWRGACVPQTRLHSVRKDSQLRLLAPRWLSSRRAVLL